VAGGFAQARVTTRPRAPAESAAASAAHSQLFNILNFLQASLKSLMMVEGLNVPGSPFRLSYESCIKMPHNWLDGHQKIRKGMNNKCAKIFV
jgi:hypothetical protein